MGRRCFRADAAFALRGTYQVLEARGCKQAVRMPANAVLKECIACLLGRPAGRTPLVVRRDHAGVSCRARPWTKPRPAVATVEWHSGEPFPSVGFIVTSMTCPDERAMPFHNHRGTAERWIEEGTDGLPNLDSVPWCRARRS
jgi:DDE family transposase